MCTLIAVLGHYTDAPVLLAANRDEHLARPATPPFEWPGSPPFLAPKDEQAGGTWLGVNAHGLAVALTNRFGVPVDPGRRSRGRLVEEALRQRSASALHAWAGALDVARFNAFHLLYVDRDGAYVTWSDGSRRGQQVLPAGVHVVTERSLGGDDRARTERIQQQMPLLLASRHVDVKAWAGLLSTHAPDDPLGSVCVHAPAFGYGTRSSALLTLGAAPGQARFLWAEGAPCQTAFADQTPALRAVLSGSNAS